MDESKVKERNIKNEIKASKLRLVQLNKDLKNAKSKGGNNRLFMFGNKMPQLVQEIQRKANQFHKMPIGPLGMEIKLKNGIPKVLATLIEWELQSLPNRSLLRTFLGIY